MPLEERRYKQPNENAFGDDRQREICRDIMAKTGAAIEISSGKDQGLTIMVTGKPELLAKARRMVLTQLQTQVILQDYSHLHVEKCLICYCNLYHLSQAHAPFFCFQSFKNSKIVLNTCNDNFEVGLEWGGYLVFKIMFFSEVH